MLNIRRKQYTLSATSQKIAEKNPSRISLFIQNQHAANEVYLVAGDGPAVNSSCITVLHGFGWYEWNLFNPWDGEVHALGTAAAETISVTEISSAS